MTDTAENYKNLSLVVKTTENLRSLGDMGAENNSQFGSTDPFIITYTDVNVGDINSKTLYFQAKVTDTAAYERITIGVYDTSDTQGAIVEEKKLGENGAFGVGGKGEKREERGRERAQSGRRGGRCWKVRVVAADRRCRFRHGGLLVFLSWKRAAPADGSEGKKAFAFRCADS